MEADGVEWWRVETVGHGILCLKAHRQNELFSLATFYFSHMEQMEQMEQSKRQDKARKLSNNTLEERMA